ncbi:MAG: hypothetical protein V4674_02060 [Patescibacteria group bacterium]
MRPRSSFIQSRPLFLVGALIVLLGIGAYASIKKREAASPLISAESDRPHATGTDDVGTLKSDYGELDLSDIEAKLNALEETASSTKN